MAYEILIPVLTFLSVSAIGASVLISRRQKKLMFEVRLEDGRHVDLPEREKAEKVNILKFIARIGNIISHGHSTKGLNEQLLRAGYLSSAAPPIYTGIKILLFATGLVATLLLLIPVQASATTKVLLALLGGSALFFIPNLFIVLRLKKHHDEIYRHLPEAVDLLEICVSSGIALDMAWNIVSDEIQHVSPILSNAMSLTNFEINLGVSRAKALQHMAERTGVEGLFSLAAILIQTERFGTSIAETLRVFAASMREERTFSAEENAEKISVRMIFPMVLFIFPAILIIVAGPAVITVIKTLILGD